MMFSFVFNFDIPIIDFIGNLLTILGFILAWWQFKKQSEENRKSQKNQNEKNWYISVIVIPQLNGINIFFEELEKGVFRSYTDLHQKKDYIKQAQFQRANKEMISSSLTHFQQMVVSFDDQLGHKISELVEQLQDCVTEITESSANLTKADIRGKLLEFKGKLISELFNVVKK